MFRALQNGMRSLDGFFSLISNLIADGVRLVRMAVRSQTALRVEILFLRKQLAFYEERHVRPKRLTDGARASLVLWSRLFEWKNALVIVKPETLIGWHRKGFKLFWRWKSQAGRPRIPEKIRRLIVQMAQENPTWGQSRVAAELSVKLGIWVSPRTVRALWPPEPDQRGPRRTSSQHWATFVRNHAQAIVACDFLVAITHRFQALYVFILMEVGTRRILRCNVTAHPTAAWTLQQFREAVPCDHPYRFLIHDRDSIFAVEVTKSSAPLGLRYCARRLGRRRQMPIANDWSGRCAASVWTS